MRTVDPEKHAARRQAILDSARKLFSRKGFHRTSTAEIGGAVGMSPGNLFHYFASKQAIIAALVEQEGCETTEYFEGLAGREDLFAAVVEFMDVILGMAADADVCAFTMEVAAEAGRDETIGALAADNDARLRAGLENLILLATSRGEIETGLDAATVATWLAALVDGVFCRVAADPAFRPGDQHEAMRLVLTRLLRPRQTCPTPIGESR